jgi:lipooligosaccharide transport system ATP-binding protein
MVLVKADNLVKHYGTLCAVDNISFEIAQGECFGFLGPNGAGKTTAMSIIYCFMPPTSGRVTVFGLDVTEQPSAIKSRIGVMPQDDNLDPDLSVFQNLIVYARYFDMPKKTSAPRAWALLDFVELRGKADVNIKDLSGGMKRRLLLARALLNDPELMIMDEPTVGLDPHSRHAVWDNLAHLKTKGTTTILTTHYMEEAQRVCDRVAIMDNGKIIEIGRPADLIQKFGGNLEDVYLNLTGKHLRELIA